MPAPSSCVRLLQAWLGSKEKCVVGTAPGVAREAHIYLPPLSGNFTGKIRLTTVGYLAANEPGAKKNYVFVSKKSSDTSIFLFSSLLSKSCLKNASVHNEMGYKTKLAKTV